MSLRTTRRGMPQNYADYSNEPQAEVNASKANVGLESNYQPPSGSANNSFPPLESESALYIDGRRATATVDGVAMSWQVVRNMAQAGASAKDWNGIIPCVSTRSDVEKILGKDSFKVPDAIGNYRYKKFRVSVYYDRKDKNNPSKNVVERMHVYPNKDVTFTNYSKKIPNFQKDFVKTEIDNRVSHVNSLAYYRNQVAGFEIWVQKNEEDVEVITRLAYFDPKDSCGKRESASPVSKSNNFYTSLAATCGDPNTAARCRRRDSLPRARWRRV
jgi:hypothetical protein